MGLIKCPDCGKEFSDRIDSCPNCYCPKEAIVKESIQSIKEKLIKYTNGEENIYYDEKLELETEIESIEIDDIELLELILLYNYKNKKMDLNKIQSFLEIKTESNEILSKLEVVDKYKNVLEKYFSELFYSIPNKSEGTHYFYSFPVNHMKKINDYCELMDIYDKYQISYNITPDYNYETIENFNRYYINFTIGKEMVTSTIGKKYSMPLYDYLITGIKFVDKVLETFEYDEESLLEILKCKLVMINHLLNAKYSYDDKVAYRRETIEVCFPNGISDDMRVMYIKEQKELQDQINKLYLSDIGYTREVLIEELNSLNKRKDKERITEINRILNYPYYENEIFEPICEYQCPICGHRVKKHSSRCNKCNMLFG